MIKVLFFIPTLGHGGAERVLVNLVNHMDQTKFDITVQTMFDVGVYKDKIKLGIKYIPGFPRYFRGNTKVYKLFSPKTLFKWYVKEEYDVIVSYLEGPSARVISGCSTDNTKLISWIHVEQNSNEYITQVFRNMYEATKCYEKYDCTVCVSNTVRDDFSRLFNNVKNIRVLYNTVETNKIRMKSKESIEDISYNHNEMNIVSVAKVTQVKGYDRLSRILKRLRDENIPVHVYIVGVGEEKVKLEKYIQENGLQDYWTFVGFRDNPYKYVANADLYVCSSYREGFSTAVTEALIVGTPVVSTNCSGAKELLGYNNEYGIVTENDEDALYQGIKKMLLEDGTLDYYQKMAKLRGSYFSTEKTVQEVEDMIKEIVVL